MITPADIENKEFSKAVRGYKEEEVDEFLDLIIVDMEKLMKENRQLKKELEKSQNTVDRHVSTETSVYDTLEAAKSLMNDIAASAERRAQVILKDAELEAALITREARESVSVMTEENNRMRRSLERMREKYRQMLELELERVDVMGTDLFNEFDDEFQNIEPQTVSEGSSERKPAAEAGTAPSQNPEASAVQIKKVSEPTTVVNKKIDPMDEIDAMMRAAEEAPAAPAEDLTKTQVNIR